MSSPDSSSLSNASTESPSDPVDNTNQGNGHHRKPRIQVIAGVVLTLVGATILGFSLQYFLFHPMTADDEYIGTRMWVVGSWLFGGGILLTFARPWVAALVAFFSPVITFALAMLLYFALVLLAPLLS